MLLTDQFARLFVAWRDSQGNCQMQRVKDSPIHEFDGYNNLLKYTMNIIDWSKGIRLTELQTAWSLLAKVEDDRRLGEAERRRKSVVAKSRPVSRSSSLNSKRRS